jgi:glycosyltransferase involved in cell wall biosynthesis
LSADRQAPLRVLIVCGGDLFAPSEKQALWFGRELARGGHEILLSLHGDEKSVAGEYAEEAAGLWIHWHRFWLGRLRRSDLRAAREFQPDLIHAWNSRPPVHVPAHSYALETSAPVFIHWEDDEWGQLRGLPAHSRRERLRHAARRALRRIHPPLWNFSTDRSLEWAYGCEAFDAITPELAREVMRRTGRECVPLLPAAAPEAWANYGPSGAIPAKLNGRHILLYTGDVNFGRALDVALAIEATGVLQHRGHDVAFVHAGRNSAAIDLASIASRAGLDPDGLIELGSLPYSEIPPLLREASILVQPGRSTNVNRFGLPSKLQSYLASGTPCITFAVGAGELLEDRVEVLKTYTDHPDELADRAEELLTDPDLTSTLALNGPRAARRLFDPTRNTEALVAHYRAVLAHLS